MSSRSDLLVPGKFYHIFNRSVGNDNLFKNGDNYRYFLKKYLIYIHPFVNTYAFCLMPNHFHFAIGIKSEDEISFAHSNHPKFNNSDPISNLPAFLSSQFGSMFISYAKAYNKTFNRVGRLFNENMKRKTVESKTYMKNLIHYIHYNPVNHGFVNDPADWTFSSYSEFQQNAMNLIQKQAVLNLFSEEEEYLNWRKIHSVRDLFLVLEY